MWVRSSSQIYWFGGAQAVMSGTAGVTSRLVLCCSQKKSDFLLCLCWQCRQLLYIVLQGSRIVYIKRAISAFCYHIRISPPGLHQPLCTVPLEPGGVSPEKSPENLAHHLHRGESWYCNTWRRVKESFLGLLQEYGVTAEYGALLYTRSCIITLTYSR